VRGPDHLPKAWCFIPLFRPLDLEISFIRLNVINTGYTIYFTIYQFMCEILSWHTKRYAFNFGLLGVTKVVIRVVLTVGREPRLD
jgi:hypothetical protein